jgi:hypothetical protein
MQYIGTFVIEQTRGWKCYIWGKPDNHIMDWRGCNYHYASVKGQPHFGFKTREAAEAWLRAKFPKDRDAKVYAGNAGDGAFYTDDMCNSSKEVHLPE